MRCNSKDKKERTLSFENVVNVEDIIMNNKRRNKDDSYEGRLRKNTPDPKTIKQTLEIFMNGYIK